MKAVHNIEPIYDSESKILILGSMPSLISRKKEFYYANPQNRFWKIIEELFSEKLNTTEEKIQFLHTHNIALWDVIESCDITSSKDSSIKNVKPNDINKIITSSKIEYIFTTGKTAYNLLKKHTATSIPIISLPSPSSANATYSLEKLTEEYKKILLVLDDKKYYNNDRRARWHYLDITTN